MTSGLLPHWCCLLREAQMELTALNWTFPAFILKNMMLSVVLHTAPFYPIPNEQHDITVRTVLNDMKTVSVMEWPIYHLLHRLFFRQLIESFITN